MSYEDAGFDAFLSRSIDDLPQVNLDSQGPVSNQIPFDRGQTNGLIGNTIRVGKIHLDGVNGRISVFDDTGNEVVRIGELGG